MTASPLPRSPLSSPSSPMPNGALAGFLDEYRGLTREACALEPAPVTTETRTGRIGWQGADVSGAGHRRPTLPNYVSTLPERIFIHWPGCSLVAQSAWPEFRRDCGVAFHDY